jgi:hypothetical protein
MTAPLRLRLPLSGLFPVIMSMIVTAVLVVVMVVVMVMPVMIMGVVIMAGMIISRVIVVTVVMMIVPMMGVTMAGIVRLAAAGIGAALGIERRFDLDHTGAEPPQHLFDHMIPADPQTTTCNLCRQMAIAEMPGDPHQMLWIVTADLDQRLRCRHHLDQPAVLQHQSVAAAQRHRLLEVEQEVQTTRPGHRHAPPVPIVEIENDCICGLLGPATGRDDLDGADHERSLTMFRPCRR